MSDADKLQSFEETIAKADLYGQWQVDRLLSNATDGPRPMGDAHVWRWADMSPLLDAACDVMPESFTARRSLMFNNPGMERRGATHTIAMGMQMIRPGETAWAHRHSIAALRFTIVGNDKLMTVVDGEPCVMEDNDLVLTPGWTWHDHHNNSDSNAVWLDVLDIPLMLSLNQIYYEPFGEESQPVREDHDLMDARFGQFRPVWERQPKERLPVHYAWRDMEAALQRLHKTDGSPFDGIALEYVNPVDGGSALPTLACWAQWLKPGQKTERVRRSSTSVVHVIRGEGRTIVGDKEIKWGPRDSFVIPNWSWHRHIVRPGNDEAILFSVNDMPVMQALGLYREEPEGTLRKGAIPPAPADLARRK